MVASAHTQADSITSTGTAQADRELAAVKSEIDRLSRRRDSIVAQLASLRDVVEGFTEDES